MSTPPRPPYRLKPEEIDEAARLLKALRIGRDRQHMQVANLDAIKHKITINMPPGSKGQLSIALGNMQAARRSLMYAILALESALEAVGWHEEIWSPEGDQP